MEVSLTLFQVELEKWQVLAYWWYWYSIHHRKVSHPVDPTDPFARFHNDAWLRVQPTDVIFVLITFNPCFHHKIQF